ncbi:MAG: dodecin family protein [Gammaproteobacteria bacterium]|jgi:flavin-binding protein dodecin
MSVARTTEITATSKKSFEAAIEKGIKRATKTLEGVTGSWIKDMEVVVTDNEVSAYKVRMMVTFMLRE